VLVNQINKSLRDKIGRAQALRYLEQQLAGEFFWFEGKAVNAHDSAIAESRDLRACLIKRVNRMRHVE
jgi:hypothetical protein